MSDLHMTIKNIKNIRECNFEIPLDNGLYAIVGENGCGKSTLMLIMSMLVKPSSRKALEPFDYQDDSVIDIEVDNNIDHWHVSEGIWINDTFRNGYSHSQNYYHGFYEGSIFYGSRFYDYNLVNSF